MFWNLQYFKMNLHMQVAVWKFPFMKAFHKNPAKGQIKKSTEFITDLQLSCQNLVLWHNVVHWNCYSNEKYHEWREKSQVCPPWPTQPEINFSSGDCTVIISRDNTLGLPCQTSRFDSNSKDHRAVSYLDEVHQAWKYAAMLRLNAVVTQPAFSRTLASWISPGAQLTHQYFKIWKRSELVLVLFWIEGKILLWEWATIHPT